MTRLSALLHQIEDRTILMPEFQRGYVWNRDQVRGLLRSLYRDYPVGSLLTWETEASSTATRGSGSGEGIKSLLLDGQQRMTTLYGVIKGSPPPFFEGDPKMFSRLHFHVDAEVFEFYAPVKMRDDRGWVDVTEFFRDGLPPSIQRFSNEPDLLPDRLTRLSRLQNILDRDFHLEKITGRDKTTDVVVDIFNRVNSGGTKLSKGDLALAKVTAEAPDSRDRMREALAKWSQAGYSSFKLDWLLRSVTAVATGRILFRELDDVSPERFRQSLSSSTSHIGHLLDLEAGRLGLDHGRVLLAPYGFPVLAKYLEDHGGNFPDTATQNKALYWLVQAGIWGRYSGSTESVMAQDMEAIQSGGLDKLIDTLAATRGGSLTITPRDFSGSGMGARFYPLLYMMTRMTEARDFVTNVPLRTNLQQGLAALQVHHLFPKAQLYAMEPPMPRGEVNAVANFAYLTQSSNLSIGKQLPEDYFAEYEAKHPGVMASQWIPEDPGLWKLERYRDFLAARRELLAQAANQILTSLLASTDTPTEPLSRIGVALDTEASEAGDDPVSAALPRLAELGVATPELDVEVAHPDSGKIITIAEAFWPDGLQPGRGAPTILDTDGEDGSRAILESLGYEVFTTPDSLIEFIERLHRIDSGEVGA
ncbi:MAG: DUF262 domain-containing protein [Microcella sp.]|uniref:GmrSD restriction endonuclease domain-containing protein n=1 Tax=Microcella sp. TaxID=1913979 RepID=UPI00331501FC